MGNVKPSSDSNVLFTKKKYWLMNILPTWLKFPVWWPLCNAVHSASLPPPLIFLCCIHFICRHYNGELLAAEQNNDDVDTVKYTKKRRIEDNYFKGSSRQKSRGLSCVSVYSLQLQQCSPSSFQLLPFPVPESRQITSLILLQLYSWFTGFSLTQ